MLLPAPDTNDGRSPGLQLRDLIASDGLIRAPGVVDALSARLVERAGFEAVHLTGSGFSRSMGFPDIGLVTMSEVVERARSIARVVRTPLIADADTGYGNAINVIRAVQEFEAAGVAGIHIEDQITPKRCGHYSGKQVIATEEMVGKVEAACAARRNRDFVIIARTDAVGIEGFDAAVQRASAYREAGADVLFVEGMESVADIRHVAANVKAPLMINMFSGGKTPILPVSELRRLKYKIVIFPSHLQRATIRAIQKALSLLQRDDIYAAEDSHLMVSFAEREDLVDFQEVEKLEKRYLAAANPL